MSAAEPRFVRADGQPLEESFDFRMSLREAEVVIEALEFDDEGPCRPIAERLRTWHANHTNVTKETTLFGKTRAEIEALDLSSADLAEVEGWFNKPDDAPGSKRRLPPTAAEDALLNRLINAIYEQRRVMCALTHP